MERSTNALAKLATELGIVCDIANRGCADETAVGKVVRKAQRIIAELAKVPDCPFRGNPRVDKSADAVVKCRAIAEEGENNAD